MMNTEEFKKNTHDLFEQIQRDQQGAQKMWRDVGSSFAKYVLELGNIDYACWMMNEPPLEQIFADFFNTRTSTQNDYSILCKNTLKLIINYIDDKKVHQSKYSEVKKSVFDSKKQQFIKEFEDFSEEEKPSKMIRNSQFSQKSHDINQDLIRASRLRKNGQFEKRNEMRSEASSNPFEEGRDTEFLKSMIKVKVRKFDVPSCRNTQAIVSFNLKKIHPNYPTNYDDSNEYSRFSLKQLIKTYVDKYLQTNQIEVYKPSKEVRIIEDLQFQKSKDAGNYIFDPFCDAVQIKLVRTDEQMFEDNFNLQEEIEIKFMEVAEGDWKKPSFLSPKDAISKLVQQLCDRTQEDIQTYKAACQAFKKEGVKRICDLFHLNNKEDFSVFKFQITWVNQLMEVLEEVKDASADNRLAVKLGINQDIKRRRQECMRTANSHKVFRYLIFQNKGIEELRTIAPLNYKNMLNAMQIVKEEIINKQLLNQLQDYFFQFTVSPKKEDKLQGGSRGLVLFGPPGTGKTVLTESLPDIIGFHLIEKGLSAADFMKSLVGESSRMIKDLVNRAKLSPHLICSVGIDEVDGLVPDRKDKDQKNKGEGIAMLLSVIGGNKDVSNLVFMTSTNHLKKIDQAIRRRLSGQYQVGRLTPQARKELIIKKLDYFKDNSEQLNYTVLITSNFTGAALDRLNVLIFMRLKKKGMENKPLKVSSKEITEITAQVAKQFSITLGIYTLPEIYSERNSKKYVCSLSFLNKIHNRFLLISPSPIDRITFKLFYATNMERYKYDDRKRKSILTSYFEKGEQVLNYQVQGDEQLDKLDTLDMWIKKTTANIFQTEVLKFDGINHIQYQKKVKSKMTSRSKPTILLIEDFKGNYAGENLMEIFMEPKKNLYIFYLASLPAGNYLEMLDWKTNIQKPFSGRIMIELNQEAKMAFQLDTAQEDETKLSFRYFLKSQKSNSPNDVIPQLVQFFTERKVSYILLLDYQLLLQNAAYDEQKTFEVIEEKMAEAKNYKNVAVIINVDSLIILNRSESDSSMGRSTSYSVADSNMYRLLLNCMRSFSMVKTTFDEEQNREVKQEKWLSIIVKHPQLVKLLKNDLTWPLTPDERKHLLEEENLNKERECVICGVSYTEKENRQEKKCMRHNGAIIDTISKTIYVLDAESARIDEINYKRSHQKAKDSQFVYACCLKGLNQPGDKAYRHIQEGENDPCEEEKEEKQDLWEQKCRKFR